MGSFLYSTVIHTGALYCEDWHGPKCLERFFLPIYSSVVIRWENNLFEIKGSSDCILAQAVNRRSLSSRRSKLDFTTDREGFAVDNWTDFSPRISAFPCQLLLHHFPQRPHVCCQLLVY
jgi:hypothetical protein